MDDSNEYGKEIDIAQYFPDGRLTVPSNRKNYDLRKMLEMVNQISRSLSEQEAESFRIK